MNEQTSQPQTAASNIFEQASRMKLRFETPRGHLYVDDLWDLPLTSATNRVNLNDIAKDLYKKLKASTDEFSLSDESQKPDVEAQLALDVVKHIYAVKTGENKAAREGAQHKAREQYLLGLLAKKQTAADENMSIDDIEKALAEVGARVPA